MIDDDGNNGRTKEKEEESPSCSSQNSATSASSSSPSSCPAGVITNIGENTTTNDASNTDADDTTTTTYHDDDNALVDRGWGSIRIAVTSQVDEEKHSRSNSSGDKNTNDDDDDDDDDATAPTTKLPTGVTPRSSGVWQAQIYCAGKTRYIGVWDKPQYAARAYMLAKEQLQQLKQKILQDKKNTDQKILRQESTSGSSSSNTNTILRRRITADTEKCTMHRQQQQHQCFDSPTSTTVTMHLHHKVSATSTTLSPTMSLPYDNSSSTPTSTSSDSSTSSRPIQKRRKMMGAASTSTGKAAGSSDVGESWSTTVSTTASAGVGAAAETTKYITSAKTEVKTTQQKIPLPLIPVSMMEEAALSSSFSSSPSSSSEEGGDATATASVPFTTLPPPPPLSLSAGTFWPPPPPYSNTRRKKGTNIKNVLYNAHLPHQRSHYQKSQRSSSSRILPPHTMLQKSSHTIPRRYHSASPPLHCDMQPYLYGYHYQQQHHQNYYYYQGHAYPHTIVHPSASTPTATAANGKNTNMNGKRKQNHTMMQNPRTKVDSSSVAAAIWSLTSMGTTAVPTKTTAVAATTMTASKRKPQPPKKKKRAKPSASSNTIADKKSVLSGNATEKKKNDKKWQTIRSEVMTIFNEKKKRLKKVAVHKKHIGIARLNKTTSGSSNNKNDGEVQDKFTDDDILLKKTFGMDVLRGITVRPSGKFQAQLYFDGRSRYIGVFDSKFEAASAYEMIRKRIKEQQYAGTYNAPTSQVKNSKSTTSKSVTPVLPIIMTATIKGAHRATSSSSSALIARSTGTKIECTVSTATNETMILSSSETGGDTKDDDANTSANIPTSTAVVVVDSTVSPTESVRSITPTPTFGL